MIKSKLEISQADTRSTTAPMSDADYDAWAKAKIENALREAKAHPENRIPQDQVWKTFGLER